MSNKEKMKQLADCFRDAASVIDEIVENDDESREDDLLGKFFVKLMKIEEVKTKL